MQYFCSKYLFFLSMLKCNSFSQGSPIYCENVQDGGQAMWHISYVQCGEKLLLKVMHYNIELHPKK